MFAPLIIPLLIVIVVPSTLTPPSVFVEAVGKEYVEVFTLAIAEFNADTVAYTLNVERET